MQTVVNVMFFVVCIVAIYFWIRFEKEHERLEILESEIYNMRENPKGKSQLVKIGDLVQAYKRGANPFSILAKISNVILDSKKDVSTDQSN